MKMWINTDLERLSSLRPSHFDFKRIGSLLAIVLVSGVLGGCALTAYPSRPGYNRDIGGYPEQTLESAKGYSEKGEISYYGKEFIGKRTASGDRYNPKELTCAHRSLPFGTRLKVENLDNGRAVIVRVNDRGPFKRSRIVDVSAAAADELGIKGAGVAQARITAIN